MKTRILGTQGLEISELGCMGLIFGYRPATNKADAIAFIQND